MASPFYTKLHTNQNAAALCVSLLIKRYEYELHNYYEQANEYIEETSQFLTIGKIQYFEAANQVQLLQGLEKEEYSTMKASLIESLSSYYHSAKESVDDGMASEEELEMIEELTKLAAQSEYFESIITEK